jgi:pyruvate formate lyase activating enzyme
MLSKAGRLEAPEVVSGRVFNIQRFCLHDGPGIRTTVFLKGCSLHCQWCANPESINKEVELGFISARCTRCRKCAPVCPEQAIALTPDGLPQIQRGRCNACGKCVEVCPADALALYGSEMTAGEVFKIVQRDLSFYQGSGGGVTLSGGEPLLQSPFAFALFQLCREAGIYTAIESAGFVNPAILKAALPLTDYVLFDLKHMDPQTHRTSTGQSNDLILRNAGILASSGVQVRFRMPLIPGVNDTPRNIEETSVLLRELAGDEARIELVPYHRLGEGKYGALDRPYSLAGVPMASLEVVDQARRNFEACGVRCTVSR